MKLLDLVVEHDALPASVAPDARRLRLRAELAVADGAAARLIAAVPDEAAVARAAELLRPVAVGGLLVLVGPPAMLAAAAALLPEAAALPPGAAALPPGAPDVLVARADPPGWDQLTLRRAGTLHPGSAGCIVCGARNASGLSWRFWQSGPRAWASGAVPAQLEGFPGVVHGGMVAAMLDDALWHAIHAATGETTMTAELTTRYRQPAPVGATLTAAGYFTGRQRRIFTAEARLWGPDGEVLATAAGRFLPGPVGLEP